MKEAYRIELLSKSPEDTMMAGYNLGSILKGNEIICLNGELGTGKTAFTSGIARALGVVGHITSPTFTIVNEYNSEIPLYHFDVYRIADPEEMFEIGFEEYVDKKGVVVIEWSKLIADILPEELIIVEIEKDLATSISARKIVFSFIGYKYIDYYIKYKDICCGGNKF